ncbi:MAG: o-succinylbenzoate--CoA ligase [Candidatus Kapaibacterium sp.]|nr:MAG: o-succinylbenzoate--CoA ligase [Candidatus Kapabacteria bacterium]
METSSHHAPTFFSPHTASSAFLYSAHPEFQDCSFHDILSAAHHAAVWLQAQGCSHGSRCAFLAHTTPETVLMLLACLRIGVVAMPLSPRFPEHVLQEVVRTAQAVFISLPDSFTTDNFTTNTPPHISAAETFQFDVQNDATILCSSGSTGFPKLFVHSAESHLLSAVGSHSNIPFTQGDCWFAALPLYHIGGYATLFRALVGGAAIALPQTRTFDVPALTRSLEQFPITHCSLVATQLHYCLGSEQAVERLRGLKAILLGGSAIPEHVIEQALKRGLKVFTSYGSTEMASQITTTRTTEREELRTSGSVLPHRELMISADGEILVRGKTLAKGQLTKQGIMPIVGEDGWYHTNDIGECDALGRLHVQGRRDNMFISGGENIHPEAIEHILLERPDVFQAIVVPVPHEIFGFRPVAFVQCAEKTSAHHRLNPAVCVEFAQNIAEKLPRFAVPNFFFPFPEEMLQSGIKPRRSELQALAIMRVRENEHAGL